MLRFKSLTAKFIFVSVIILTFLSIYFYADFRFTHHMEGEARRINLAGRERMLTVSTALYVKSFVLGVIPFRDERVMKEFDRLVAEYEEALYGLRDGSERLGLKPIQKHNQESIAHLNTLIEQWEKTHKQTILNLMRFPPERKDKPCVICHSAIREHLSKIETLVKSLEEHNAKEIKDFDTFRLYALGFFFAGAIFIILFIRQSIVNPIRRLRDAAKLIEEGRFDIGTEIKTSDEIGALSKTFNSMSQAIQKREEEIKERYQIQTSLNSLLRISLEETPLDKQLEHALDVILAVPFLPLTPKGGVFLVEEEPDVLVLKANRNLPVPLQGMCARVPFGRCRRVKSFNQVTETFSVES